MTSVPDRCPFPRQCKTIATAIDQQPDLLVDVGINNELVDLFQEGGQHISRCSETGKCVLCLSSHEYDGKLDQIKNLALALLSAARMQAGVNSGSAWGKSSID